MKEVRGAAAGADRAGDAGLEKKTNPFLRPDSAEIRKSLGMEKADTVSVFGEIRERKNNF